MRLPSGDHAGSAPSPRSFRRPKPSGATAVKGSSWVLGPGARRRPGERDLRAVRRPGGAEVEARNCDPRDLRFATALDVEDDDAAARRRCPRFGDAGEGNARSVRRPGRGPVERLVRRQPTPVRPVCAHDVDLGQALIFLAGADLRGERDLRAVGRPGGAHVSGGIVIRRLDLGQAPALGPVWRHHPDLVPARVVDREGDLAGGGLRVPAIAPTASSDEGERGDQRDRPAHQPQRRRARHRRTRARCRP